MRKSLTTATNNPNFIILTNPRNFVKSDQKQAQHFTQDSTSIPSTIIAAAAEIPPALAAISPRRKSSLITQAAPALSTIVEEIEVEEIDPPQLRASAQDFFINQPLPPVTVFKITSCPTTSGPYIHPSRGLSGSGKSDAPASTSVSSSPPAHIASFVCFVHLDSAKNEAMVFAAPKVGFTINDGTILWQGQPLEHVHLKQQLCAKNHSLLSTFSTPLINYGASFLSFNAQTNSFIQGRVHIPYPSQLVIVRLDEDISDNVVEYLNFAWDKHFTDADMNRTLSQSNDQCMRQLCYFLMHPTSSERLIRAPNDGLSNNRNICWFNSTLQMFASSELLLRTLLSYDLSATPLHNLTQLLHVLHQRQTASSSTLIAIGYKDGRVGWSQYINKLRDTFFTDIFRGTDILRNNRQQCLGEGLIPIFTALNLYCKPAYDLFVGRFQKVKTCRSSSIVSPPEEYEDSTFIMNLADKVTVFNLQQEIDANFIHFPYSDSEVNCTVCGKKDTHVYHHTLIQPPRLMFLGLTRMFTVAEQSFKTANSITAVQQPVTLCDMPSRLLASSIHLGAESHEGHYEAIVVNPANPQMAYKYSDQSVITCGIDVMQENSSLLTHILYEFPPSRPSLQSVRLSSQSVVRVHNDSTASVSPSASNSSLIASTSGSTANIKARMPANESATTTSSRQSSISVPLVDVALTSASLKTKQSDSHPISQRKRLRRTNLLPSTPLTIVVVPTDAAMPSPSNEPLTLQQSPIQVPAVNQPILEMNFDLPDNIHVTQFVKTDIEQIIQLRTQLDTHYQVMSADIFHSNLMKKAIRLYVVRRQDRLLAYCYFTRTTTTIHLQEIVVNLLFRRRGIARAIIKHFQSRARIKRIAIRILQSDCTSRALFISQNFSASRPLANCSSINFHWTSRPTLRVPTSEYVTTHFSNTGACSIEIKGGSVQSLHRFAEAPQNLLGRNSNFISTSNVRSLRNALKLQDILYFEQPNMPMNLVVLTEVQASCDKLEKNEKFKRCVAAYPFCFWNTCVSPVRTTGYSGVGILSTVLPSQVLFDFEGEDPHLSEGRIITLYFGDCIVMGVYSPATIADDDLTRIQFDNKLIQHVRRLRATKQLPVLVLGDLNVPPEPEDVSVGTPWLPRPRTFISERKAFQQLLEAGSFQDSTSSCGFTWHPEPHRYYQSVGVGQRLDLILLPHQWKVLSRKIRHLDTYSDHRPVVVEFSAALSILSPRYGLRKMMTIGSGLDLSLFPESSNAQVTKQDNNELSSLFRIFIGEHSKLQSITAIHREKYAYVPKYNGLHQKALNELVLPSDSEEEAEPCSEVPDRLHGIYHTMLKDDGTYVRPQLSQYFVSSHANPEGPCLFALPARSSTSVVPSYAKLKLATQDTFHTVLLDTGSDLCLIDYAFAMKSVIGFAKDFVMWSRKLTLGDGNSQMSILGFITLLCHFQSIEGKLIEVSQIFFCVYKLKECFIIGDVFFHTDQKNHNANLNPSAREMTLKGQTIPYVWKEQHFHITAPFDIRIAGKAIAEVKIAVAGITGKADGQFFDKCNVRDVYVSSVVREKDFITLSLLNQSRSTQLVGENDSIGCFQQIKSAHPDAFEALFSSNVSNDPARACSSKYISQSSKCETNATSDIQVNGNGIRGPMGRRHKVHVPTVVPLERNSTPHSAEARACGGLPSHSKLNHAIMIPLVNSDSRDSELTGGNEISDIDKSSLTEPSTTDVIMREPPKSEVEFCSPVIILQSSSAVKPRSLPASVQLEIDSLIAGWVEAEGRLAPSTRHDEGPVLYVQPFAVEPLHLQQSNTPPRQSEPIFTTPCRSKTAETEVANYFDDHGDLVPHMLPDYLRAWKLNLKQVTLSRSSMNKFISRVLVKPEGLSSVFVTDQKPGTANNVEVHVELSDITPWNVRLRSLSPQDREDLEAVVNADLKKGTVEVSTSDRASRVLLVKKRGVGPSRNKIATDFKEFNEKTIPFPYPLPLLNDCLDMVSRAKFLSSIDIVGAYLSLCIPAPMRHFFAFVCHLGLFQWTRLPYGWKNSGSFFYKCMAATFMGLIYVILCVYSDDTFIFGGDTEDEHMACISIAIQRCRAAGLHLDITKCFFFAITLEYLGFQAVKGGIRPLQRNVEKIIKLQVTKVKDLRSFVGLANFYRRFVPGFGQIVKPLNAFLSKNAKLPKPLPPDVADAIESIKNCLTQYPVLVSPDMTKRFFLCVDGSKTGLGAMLCQLCGDDNKMLLPCAYASSALTLSQQAYSSPMLESLAAVWAMLHFKHYLRVEFTLKTDQVVLKWLRTKKNNLGPMMKWVIESQGFSFTIEHVPGRIHHGPDLLSRAGARLADICHRVQDLDDTEYVFSNLQTSADVQMLPQEWKGLSPSDVPSELCRDDWIKAQSKDLVLQKIVSNNTAFRKIRDLWYFAPDQLQPRVVLPLSLRAPLLMLVHGLIGHRGAKPIEKHLNRVLYWISAPLDNETTNMTLRRFVRRWITSCVDCNRRKMNAFKQPALTPLYMHMRNRQKPMQTMGVDWAGRDFPQSSEGFRYLFTVLCLFSAFPIPICLRTNDPTELGESLFAQVFSIFGFPKIIHSDNDPRFEGAMAYVFKKFGIRTTKILPRHPEMNGAVERWHRYLNASFCIVLPNYTKWPQMVHIGALAYRAMVQETTGFSPFFVLFGQDMLLPLESSLGFETDIDLFEGDTTPACEISQLTSSEQSQLKQDLAVKYVNETAERLQAAFKLVRRSRFKASLKYQENARKDKQVSFKVGDAVYLKEPAAVNLQGKMRTSLFLDVDHHIPQKWKFLWSGPHPVSATHRNPTRYTIFHSDHKCDRDVHISDLRKHTPFSTELFDTSCPTVCEPYQPPPEGFTLWSTSSGVATPKVGDVCIVRLLQYQPEDICVLKLLADGTFQWYSNPRSSPQVNRQVRNTQSFDLFKQTYFLPGWELDATRTAEVEYRELKPDETQIPFVANHADIIPFIFLWGVQFQNNHNFNRATLAWIEQECKRQDEAVGTL